MGDPLQPLAPRDALGEEIARNCPAVEDGQYLVIHSQQEWADALPRIEPLTPEPPVSPDYLSEDFLLKDTTSITFSGSPWQAGAVVHSLCEGLDPPTFWLKASELIHGRGESILDEVDRQIASEESNLALACFPGARGKQALRYSEIPSPNLWILGDLHGDLLALEAALLQLERITAEEGLESPCLVFLGDLVDRGPSSVGVVLRVLELLLKGTGRVCLLAGNHEDALGQDPDGTFHSSVFPSDFTDDLNKEPPGTTLRRTGATLVRLSERLPRALLLPNGLLVAHGGIPHTDLHASLKDWDDLESTACLQDFVWTRAHDRAKRKIPNRNSRGCEFGVQDFDAFCELASNNLGTPVHGLVRGHSHETDRFAQPPAYVNHPLLTINTLSHRLPDEMLGPFPRTPCLARYRPNGMPDVYRIEIPEAQVLDIYPSGRP